LACPTRIFSPPVADAFSQLMAYETQEEEQTNVKPPGEFKAGNSICGQHCLPLAYLIQTQEELDPDAVYGTEHERLIDIPHQGLELSDDNGKVFDYLKLWTLTGPAWTRMQSFYHTRDRQAAWSPYQPTLNGVYRVIKPRMQLMLQ